MKKVILLISIAIFAFVACTKEEVNQKVHPTPEISIVGKWNGKLVTGFDSNLTKMDTVFTVNFPLDSTFLHYEFKLDGTFSAVDQGEIITGTYEFENSKVYFVTDGGIDILPLSKLTAYELVYVIRDRYVEQGISYLSERTITLERKL